MDSSDFKTRILFIGIIFIFILLAIGGRFYFVQVHRHKELYSKARSIYTRVQKSTGQRGEIYDINGSLLAGNIPCFNIIADPSLTGDQEKCDILAENISKILIIPKEKVLRKISTKKRNDKILRYAMIKRNVSLQDGEKLKVAIKHNRLKGLFFKETTKRYYPKDSLLAQTLGFVNVDKDVIVPVIGLEKVANDEVSSEEGVIKTERDRKGRSLSYGFSEIDESHNGKNVYLTIDEQIQIIVEDELDKLYNKFKPKAVYAIMVNPQNGNILAMAQRPTFNPNDRKSMNPVAWRNRMASDVLEPGSTMKPIVIASALDYNVVKPNTKFYCENGYWRDMRLRDSHRMKDATVSHILSESSNIGTAKIAIKMGKNLLYKTFRRFGFGTKTGTPLKEVRGFLRKPHKWDYLSISRFPIGQGIAVTPLQLVRAYCGIASGRLFSLRLIDRIEDGKNHTIEVKPIEVAPKLFRNSFARREVIEMMKLVTKEGGTAKKAAIPGYEVAGKTGTSQKWISHNKETGVKGHYSQKDFFASFIGFVPAEKPAFVLAVIADEPIGSHYGGVVSAPTFREISKRTLAYLNVQPVIKK